MNEKLKTILFNIPGWHTNRKIIVFESDDWGSIRMPSRDTYDYLAGEGYAVGDSPYSKDCLESNDDLAGLLEVLSSFKNRDGSHPVFTLNFLVANPDFEKIRQDNFRDYHYEIFTETYRRYPAHDRSFGLLLEGVGRKLFRPQLHGREHLNVRRWLRSLNENRPETRALFDRHMYGLPVSLTRDDRRDFQRAFDHDNAEDAGESCSIITDACRIFRDTWGYTAESFIAPNFFWDDNVEKCLSENGIKYIQGQRAQLLSDLNGGSKVKFHYTGQSNRYGQVYFTRNCRFEPSSDQVIKWVERCLKEISYAFFLRKPALISTHRVNYAGTIKTSNRDKNLNMLSTLLKDIINQWPEVEFFSSDQLGNLINQGINTRNYGAGS